MPFLKTEYGLRYRFSAGLMRDTLWTVAGSVCQGPTCGCTSLTLGLAPVSEGNPEPGEERRLTLDIRTGALDDQSRSNDPLFAAALVSQMDDHDWGLMRGLFQLLKDQLYDGLDLSILDADLRMDEIECEGLLVSYNGVFPFHNLLRATAQGQSYSFVDHYCLRPSCDCKNVIVAACSIPDGERGEDTVATEQFTVAIDLQHRRWQQGEMYAVPAVPVPVIMKAFMEQADYDLLLERRRVLRALYRHNRERLGLAWRTGEPRIEPAVPAVRRETPKVRRNDPCPCGSGRKFKKCCGR